MISGFLETTLFERSLACCSLQVASGREPPLENKAILGAGGGKVKQASFVCNLHLRVTRGRMMRSSRHLICYFLTLVYNVGQANSEAEAADEHAQRFSFDGVTPAADRRIRPEQHGSREGSRERRNRPQQRYR